jgi:CubicO group peptidase (beta-lactamase class C family)
VAFSAGAIVSTAEDLGKWDAALGGEKLLPQASLRQMWTATKLKDGSMSRYGFGWSVATQGDRTIVFHSGSIPGFSTQISRHLTPKLTVVVLANAQGQIAPPITRQVAQLYLGQLTGPATRPQGQ